MKILGNDVASQVEFDELLLKVEPMQGSLDAVKKDTLLLKVATVLSLLISSACLVKVFLIK